MYSYQQESIYNLVPQERFLPPKQPLYKSRFPHDLQPTGSTFGLMCSSFPGVANLSGSVKLNRGAHPLTNLHATFGKPDGNHFVLN